jgi:mannose-6-phosphate isomerase
VQPVRLPANQLHRFYKGGARIAELRGSGKTDPYAPEEWIASMASPFGEPGVGVSALPDGTSLADAVRADPDAYLGPAHVERFGADVAVLIKLLDAGERLPVHLHPDDAFAREHLDSQYGKTEAWIILHAEPGAAVYVGFREPVERATVDDWVERQDADAMLAALNPYAVAPGATLFVPAGTPHAIGEGILLAELQQPTDFSVLLEWEGFAIDGPQVGHLGLGFDVALGSLNRSPWSEADLRAAASTRRDGASRVENLFPADADAFFRAQRITSGSASLEAAFCVLLGVNGSGRLTGDGWGMELDRGDAVLVPYAAGETVVETSGQVLRCMPPLA